PAGPRDAAGWKRVAGRGQPRGRRRGAVDRHRNRPRLYGGKSPAFYRTTGFFWVKLVLFALVFALEIAPMVTFIRVRSHRRRGAPLPQFSVDLFRRVNSAETVFVVSIAVVCR